jgi:hypothetical protein
MKKLFLIVCAAFLFSGGAFAQVTQDLDSTDNNYVAPKDSVESSDQDNSTEDDGINDRLQKSDADDSDSTRAEDNGINDRLEDGENDVKKDADKVEEGIEKTGNEIKSGAEETADEVKTGAERAADEVEKGAEKTGDAIQSGAEKTEDAIQSGAEETRESLQEPDQADSDADTVQSGAGSTGEAVKEDAEKTGDTMNEEPKKTDDAMKTSVDTETTGTADAEGPNFGPEVEVLEDKEGPQNQVVYKINDELYYVDREQQQMVKVKESDIKDAEHPAVIHSGDMKAAAKK